jgi:hypothetical protein
MKVFWQPNPLGIRQLKAVTTGASGVRIWFENLVFMEACSTDFLDFLLSRLERLARGMRMQGS